MTPEERIEMHDQWLRSMEGNHSRLVEDLVRGNERVDRLEQHLTNYQKLFTEHMVTVAMNQAAFAASQAKLSEELRDLREVVDRFVRFRGNRNPPAN